MPAITAPLTIVDVAYKLITVLAMVDMLKDENRRQTLLDGEMLAADILTFDIEFANVLADELGPLGLLLLEEEGHPVRDPAHDLIITERAAVLVAESEARQRQALTPEPFNALAINVRADTNQN